MSPEESPDTNGNGDTKGASVIVNAIAVLRSFTADEPLLGVTEIANFAKYLFTSSSSETCLSRMMTNKIPKTGRIVLTPMLNPNGKLIGDFTIAKAGDDCFYMWGSSQAQKYHMRWFEQHLPDDGSVRIDRLDMGLVGLSIAGPKSRARPEASSAARCAGTSATTRPRSSGSRTFDATASAVRASRLDTSAAT